MLIAFLVVAAFALGVMGWIAREMYTEYPKYMSKGRYILGWCLLASMTALIGGLVYGVVAGL